MKDGLKVKLEAGVEFPESTLSWAPITMDSNEGKFEGRGAPVGERVVKGLCRYEGTKPAGAILGNGYDGVPAIAAGVVGPRMVAPDSVDVVVDMEV